MERVSIDDIEPAVPFGEDIDRRGLTEPLGTEDLALNRYALDPGQVFSGGLHAHLDQEEVFCVVSGTATFEAMAEVGAETETVEVGPGEAIRFAPGEFQQGHNESDEEVIALALGAPKGTTEGRVPQPCPECGESDVLAVVMGEGGNGASVSGVWCRSRDVIGRESAGLHRSGRISRVLFLIMISDGSTLIQPNQRCLTGTDESGELYLLLHQAYRYR